MITHSDLERIDRMLRDNARNWREFQTASAAWHERMRTRHQLKPKQDTKHVSRQPLI